MNTLDALKSYIHILENALPDELCDRIIAEYENDDDWVYAEVGTGVVQTDIRNVRSTNISIAKQINKNFQVRKKLDEDVFVTVNKAIEFYRECHPSVVATNDSGYDLLQYGEGQFYTQHTDSYADNPREVSCSIALNDEYEGGEFAFFDGQLRYKLKKGSILMFPSNFMYPHEVMPVQQGIRYSIITWFV